MKPKNVKERRNSFFKFLLLFLVTVGTIVTAVYFNFKVPSKENELLKDQAKVIEKEIDFQSDFSEQMESIKRMIDSLETPGVNIPFQNNLISKKLVNLQEKIPVKDSTYRYDMYTNIVSLFAELQETKDKLRDLKDAEMTIQEYKEALDNCKQDYKEVQRDLDIARRSSN